MHQQTRGVGLKQQSQCETVRTHKQNVVDHLSQCVTNTKRIDIGVSCVVCFYSTVSIDVEY